MVPWLFGRLLTVGRLAVEEPVRPLVPAVGLEVLVGLAEALEEPVLPEVLPDMLPAEGRLAVAPLIEPFALVRPETLAPPLLEGRRELIEPLTPLLPCLTLAT